MGSKMYRNLVLGLLSVALPVVANADAGVTRLSVAGEIEANQFFGDGIGLRNLDKAIFKTTVLVDAGTLSGPAGDGLGLKSAMYSLLGKASATRPYVLKLEPGEYDMGAIEGLQVFEYVDIEGSGEHNTKITGSLCGSGTGIVTGAAHSQLRFLTVENKGLGDNCTGIYNPTDLLYVTAAATDAGGNNQNGLLLTSVADAKLDHVTAKATGQNGVHGMLTLNSSVVAQDSSFEAIGVAMQATDMAQAINMSLGALTLRNSRVFAKSTGTAFGLYLTGLSSANISNSEVTVGNETAPYGMYSRGIYSANMALRVNNTQVVAKNASLSNIGAWNANTDTTNVIFQALNSSFEGAKYSVRSDLNLKVRMAGVLTAGTVYGSAATHECLHSFWQEGWEHLAADCGATTAP